MIVRFYQGWFQMLYLDLPCSRLHVFCLVVSTGGPTRALSAGLVETHKIHAFPHGHRHRPCRQQLRGGALKRCWGRQSNLPHPKVHVELKEEGGNTRSMSANAAAGKPYVELGLAAYFVFTTAYSFRVENYLTVPFLLLFFTGIPIWG